MAQIAIAVVQILFIEVSSKNVFSVTIKQVDADTQLIGCQQPVANDL